MTADHRTVSDRTLELLALEELPPETSAALERRLRDEPELAARLEALRESDGEVLARHPPAAVAAEVRRRAAVATRPRRWRPLLFVAGPALAGAVALALVVMPTPTALHGGPADPEERIKGTGPHLVAVLVRGIQAEPLGDGAQVAAGDAIQLAYVSAGLPYGVIVSIDGRGTVTLHWPEDPQQPPRLEPRGQVALPHAFQLDDAPGFERFFLVAAREPVQVARVLEAARAAGRDPAGAARDLDLPRSWIQSSFKLRKATR